MAIAPRPSQRGAEIGFLRRLLGQDAVREDLDTRNEPNPVRDEATAEPAVPARAAPVSCPNCGTVLDPPPGSSRLCPRCRRRIVVRHSGGRAIYLTEAAVEVFESERRREADEESWARQRRHWLQLARLVAAPADRRQRIAATPLTEAAVQAARTLYLGAADQGAAEARREKRWEDVARIRERQAAALFEEGGGRPPVPDEILGLYREAKAATLRGLSGVARDAELVGASCCPACRADDEHVFRIAEELRTPRLPHPTCPRGLCACDWWPTVRQPGGGKKRRRARTTVAIDPAAGAG